MAHQAGAASASLLGGEGFLPDLSSSTNASNKMVKAEPTTNRDERDTLADELVAVDRTTTGDEQDTLADELVAVGRTATGDKQKSKIDVLVPVADQATKQRDRRDDKTESAVDRNIGGSNSRRPGLDEIFTLTLRRPNGVSVCIRWHKDIPSNSHAIVRGERYPPLEDNGYFRPVPPPMFQPMLGNQRRRPSESSTIFLHGNVRYPPFSPIYDCTRYPPPPIRVPFHGHTRYHESMGPRVWRPRYQAPPPMVPTRIAYEYPPPMVPTRIAYEYPPPMVPTRIAYEYPPPMVPFAPGYGPPPQSMISVDYGRMRHISPGVPSVWPNPFVPFDPPFFHPRKSFWFHGTDFEDAKSIIRNGIVLHRGRPNRQFSDGLGFYLSENFEQARRWACRATVDQPTVVVFRLSFSFNHYRGLNLTRNEQDWQDIVKFCLNHHHKQVFNINEALYHHYITSDYVYGPLLTNKPNFANLAGWRATGFQSPYRQLCVRNKNLAENIGCVNHIDSVMTFTR